MVLFLFSIGVGLLYMFYRSLNSDQKKVLNDIFDSLCQVDNDGSTEQPKKRRKKKWTYKQDEYDELGKIVATHYFDEDWNHVKTTERKRKKWTHKQDEYDDGGIVATHYYDENWDHVKTINRKRKRYDSSYCCSDDGGDGGGD